MTVIEQVQLDRCNNCDFDLRPVLRERRVVGVTCDQCGWHLELPEGVALVP